jgi:hypothetical protein
MASRHAAQQKHAAWAETAVSLPPDLALQLQQLSAGGPQAPALRSVAAALLAFGALPSTYAQVEALTTLTASLQSALAAADAVAWRDIAQLLAQLLLAPGSKPFHRQLLIWASRLNPEQQAPLSDHVAALMAHQLGAAGGAAPWADGGAGGQQPGMGLVHAASSLLNTTGHPRLGAWLAPLAAELLLALGRGTSAVLVEAEASGSMPPQVS